MSYIACPLCESTDVNSIGAGVNSQSINENDFKITDSKYGQTGPLYRCKSCSFVFVVFPNNFLDLYTKMEDEEYEQGRCYRSIQQKIILKHLLKKFPETNSILDVGSGTGMLVEQALNLGLEPVGVELSQWCVDIAKSQGLPLIQGAVPHPDLEGRYFDAVTLIDVIEHVPNPVELLTACAKHLQPGSPLILVTPDVNSILARLLGKRWWHYRIAHVGYFSKHTIDLALQKAGFRILSIRRPAWYFQAHYLYERLKRYIPLPNVQNSSNTICQYVFSRIIPLNIRDSLEVIACKI